MANGHRRSRKEFRDFIRETGAFGQRAENRSPEYRETGGGGSTLHPGTSGRNYMFRFFGLLRPQSGRLSLILFMSIVMVLLQSSIPWSSKLMIDLVLPQRNVALLVGCCIVMLVLSVSALVIGILQDYVRRSVRGKLVTQVKRRVMKHLQVLPLPRVQELKVGRIVSRIQTDTQGLAQLLQAAVFTPFNCLLMLSIGLASLLALNWRVTIICVLFCFSMGGIAFVIFHLLRPLQKSLRREQAVISGRVAEMFSGVEVVRAFNQERSETRTYATDTHLLWRKQLHAGAMHMTLVRLVRLLFRSLTVCIWLVGGYHHMRNPDSMPLGSLVAFITFSNWIFMPVQQLVDSMAQVQLGVACLERVFDLLDEPAAAKERDEGSDIERLDTDVEFRNVVFGYEDGVNILEGVDLVLRRGCMTAVVGPSGSGKSTITNLLMRFYEPGSGKILINGRDISTYRLDSYRSLLSLVLQDTYLFDGTIAQNIAYGRPGATREEIENAAHVAHSHEFIDEMEDGYDTVCGERGVKLSGGQRQRIALARAVLMDPQILILDEATSNLDSESETLIQQALRDIFEGRTTLVIAHRLSTVMDADNIVVLEKGSIVEQGTHEALVAANGRYATMLKEQMSSSRGREDGDPASEASGFGSSAGAGRAGQ